MKDVALVFLLYSPLNQGLKLTICRIAQNGRHCVFTLQSIKSRIETYVFLNSDAQCCQFLLYSPLNQGLKLKRMPK
mgnify:FL=1